MPEKTAEVNK